MTEVTPGEILQLHKQLKTEAETAGYHLNPDAQMVEELCHGLLVNEKRFGYRACPCRLASGKKKQTWISSAPVITATPTLMNTARAIAACMSPGRWQRVKLK
jgi:ferredoxin-thioredoxin reductase catalytic subunit